MQTYLYTRIFVTLFCLVFLIGQAACTPIPGEMTQPTQPVAVAQTESSPVFVRAKNEPPAPASEPESQGTLPTQAAIEKKPSAIPGKGLLAAGVPKPPPCDLVAPGQPIDVTTPDGTKFLPGEAFSKTWRLVNVGHCPWTSEYAVVWFSGQQFGAIGQQFISIDVQPGQAVEITVDMVAPDRPGRYQSNWKLRDPKGKLFGLGPNGDAPFWVQIEVMETSTSTAPPEPSEAPPQPVYASGVITIISSDRIDLNTGQINPAANSDLLYQVTAEGRAEFVLENGASLAFYGVQEPSQIDCQQASLSTDSLQLPLSESGAFFCYRTARGLPGFAHISNLSSTETPLVLDFVTWTVP